MLNLSMRLVNDCEKVPLRREAHNAPGWLIPTLLEIARSETKALAGLPPMQDNSVISNI